MSVGSVSKSSYSAPKKIFTDPADYGGNGPNIFDSIAESIQNARKSDPNAWQQISNPQKTTPGASKTVPLGAQRSLKRTVSEPAATATAAQKAKPFDAGMIAQNSGRIVILGQLGANDAQDTYKITLNSAGKLSLFTPNPDYDSTKPGSKITLGDAQVELFDSKGTLIATSDTRNADGFSKWISLSTDGLGGLQLERGSYTVKVTRDNPASNLAIATTSLGELNFDGTVLDDKAKVGAVVSNNLTTVITNSDGVKYNATYQLVKKTEGGVPPTTGTPDATAGLVGGPDEWELQLISLKPVNTKDKQPAPTTAPSATAPVKVGTFKVYTGTGTTAAPKAEFTATDAVVTFDDTSTLTTPGSKVLTGKMKLSADGAHTVADTTKVNYSLFAAMGDPGATTFYTVKNTPLTPAEQKKADQDAAVAAAKKSAKAGTSSSILSLFS